MVLEIINEEHVRLPSTTATLEVVLPTLKEVKRARRAARKSASLYSQGEEHHGNGTRGGDQNVKAKFDSSVKAEPIDDPALLAGSNTRNEAQPFIKKEEDIEHAPEQKFIITTFVHTTDKETKARIVQALSNPNAKIKKDLEFDYEFVWDRLKDVTGGIEWFKIDLDKKIQEHTFSRYYISNLYGGGTVETLPTPDPEKVKVHGIDNFCFPSLESNPHAPKHAGAPGLFFITGDAAGWPIHDSRVFVRLNHGRWLYCGTYRFEPSKLLTPFEFQNQSERVQRRWAKDIKSKMWGLDVLVRIYLRLEHGHDPSEEEVDDLLYDKDKSKSLSNEVTEDHIIHAFRRGEEFLVDNYRGWETEYLAKRAAAAAKRGAIQEGKAGKARARTAKETAREGATNKRWRLARGAGLIGVLSDLSELDESDVEEHSAQEVGEEIEVDKEDPLNGILRMTSAEDKQPREDRDLLVLRTIARGTRSRPRGTHIEPIMLD